LLDSWVQIDGPNWALDHVKPLLARHPYWACVGKDGKHLRLVFDEHQLEPFIQALAADRANRDGVAHVDLSKSNLIFLQRMEDVFKLDGDPLDPDRVENYQAALAKFERRLVEGKRVGFSPSETPYWYSLLCGLAEMKERGSLTPDNTYYQWWSRGLAEKQIDPGLAIELPTEELRLARLSERASAMIEGIRTRTMRFDRPIIYNPVPNSDLFQGPSYYKIIHADGTDLFFTDLDGYHRLFFARLLGFNQIEMQLAWYPALPGMERARSKYPAYERMIEDHLAA
jgi:hypothetical protein